MHLKPSIIESIPEETMRIAHAAFPKGNLYISMRDELGIAFSDADFAELFPRCGQPAFAPWRPPVARTTRPRPIGQHSPAPPASGQFRHDETLTNCELIASCAWHNSQLGQPATMWSSTRSGSSLSIRWRR